VWFRPYAEVSELTDLEALRLDPVPSSAVDYGDGALIFCDRLVRIYSAEGIEVQALQGLDLVISPGELTAMVGASGSGKSTLMNILAGLDAPTAGVVRVAGHDLGSMSPPQRLEYRRSVVGFIWQQTSRNLLPYLTGQQNIQLPLRLAGAERHRTARRARCGALRAATPRPDVRRRAAASFDRRGAGELAVAAARRRADR
jgi:ABC-type glutathione transport system ATPase component